LPPACTTRRYKHAQLLTEFLRDHARHFYQQNHKSLNQHRGRHG
jgi:hypothetical protein